MKSIERHQQQGDQGDVERAFRLAEAKRELCAVEEELKVHRRECSEAEVDYKDSLVTARPLYQATFAAWMRLLQAYSDVPEADELLKVEAALIETASSLRFIMASDYQEEKLIPSWKKSPQPGATFFMSKMNIHVHIFDVPSCGVNKDTSKFGKRVIYNRLETVGGSKDSNDTVSTMMDFLFSPPTPTCQQPPMFRTGYNQDGAIANFEHTVIAEVAAESAANIAVSSNISNHLCSENAQLPSPYVPAKSAPTSQELSFSSEEGAGLVGATIFYRWPEPDGWCLGAIERQNMDSRVKVGGEKVNFIVQYACDGEEGKHCLTLEKYAQLTLTGGVAANAPDGTWLLCVPSSTHIMEESNSINISPGALAPTGYEVQEEPPSAEETRFGGAAGRALVGREILFNWGGLHGWCKGTIVAQNTKSVTINNELVNFIVEYPDDPQTKHALHVDKYSTARDAPQWSWVLLNHQDVTHTPPLEPLPMNLIQELSDQVPHPFIRDIRWQMDNCGGTNKNQYVFGCLALLIMVSILDVGLIDFMKAGHTKFEPDDTARHTAGAYNSSDTFNPAMWLQYCKRYATACFYDGALLRTWKEATTLLFRAVENITTYHSFLFVADDGLLELSELAADTNERMSIYLKKEKGGFFSNEQLEQQVKLLKKRSLQSVITAVRNRSHHGVGAGNALYNNKTAQFFPPRLGTVRTVRLFKRLHQTDSFWIEQASYQKTVDPIIVCEAMKKAVQYDMSQIPGQCPKPYWGARDQNIKDQYAKFVPPQYVPDEFNLAQSGCSGTLSSSAVEFVHPHTLKAMPAETAVPCLLENAALPLTLTEDENETTSQPITTVQSGKYKHSVHGPVLLEACGGIGSEIITDKKKIHELAESLMLEYKQVKYGLNLLLKTKDIHARKK